MNLIATPLLLLPLLAAEGKPVPKFPVGKETTYVTGPLDKEAYIDYEAALNDRLGKGIAPAKNANVLLWKAFGPTPEGGAGMPAEFFKRLGIAEPPKDGDYFIGLRIFMKDHLKLEPGAFGAVYDQQSRAGQRVWAAKDYTHIAAWLKANEKPLAVVVEATKRPDYFNPLVSRRAAPARLTARCPAPGRAKVSGTDQRPDRPRHAAVRRGEVRRGLAGSARLPSAQPARRPRGHPHRGPGRHRHRPAREQRRPGLPRTGQPHPKQVRDHLKDLQDLPPVPPMADKMDLGERFTYLDSLQLIRRSGTGMLEGLADGPLQKLTAEELKALAMIDWTPALRNGNRWYDRLAAALRHKERADREKALDKIEADLKSLKKNIVGPATTAKLILEKEPPDKVIGKVSGNILTGLLMPAARLCTFIRP